MKECEDPLQQTITKRFKFNLDQKTSTVSNSLQPRIGRTQQRESSLGGDFQRMTSEEREIARSRESKAEFVTMHKQWERFYEKKVRPTAALPYEEQIFSQRVWSKKALTAVKPFNFAIGDRMSLRQQSHDCSSDGLRAMVFSMERMDKVKSNKSRDQEESKSIPRKSLSEKSHNRKALQSKSSLHDQTF